MSKSIPHIHNPKGNQMSNKIGYKNPPSRKGCKLTEETKEKMSASHRGITPKNFQLFFSRRNEFKKGMVAWNKGIPSSKETKKKLKGLNLGENSGKWKGGISKQYQRLRSNSFNKVLRELILVRDNFTCQNKNCMYCNNVPTRKLHIHHIKPFKLYPELRNNPNNLICYCPDFHYKNYKQLHGELCQNTILV